MSVLGDAYQPFEVRPRRDIVVVKGGDAEKYLHGQLSQDVAKLEVGERAWSLLLQPQGKVDAWFRVTRDSSDQFTIDVDAGFGDAVETRLKRFLIRTDATVELTQRNVTRDHEPVDEAARIRAGVPAMGAELTESTIPAEIGQWLIDASVSFTKGCYTGQELVARVDSRGSNTPRKLQVVEGDYQPGDPVIRDDEEIGTVTSAADGVALAFIKRAALD